MYSKTKLVMSWWLPDVGWNSVYRPTTCSYSSDSAYCRLHSAQRCGEVTHQPSRGRSGLASSQLSGTRTTVTNGTRICEQGPEARPYTPPPSFRSSLVNSWLRSSQIITVPDCSNLRLKYWSHFFQISKSIRIADFKEILNRHYKLL